MHKQKGFTLIELLVVIAIIVLLTVDKANNQKARYALTFAPLRIAGLFSKIM